MIIVLKKRILCLLNYKMLQKILDHRFVINNINFEFKSGNIYGLLDKMVVERQCFYEL